MKEFVNKLVTRLEQMYGVDPMYYGSEAKWAVDKAIEIVNELTEEYNNGWIPCAERLPEEATTYEVTEEVIVNSKKQYIVVHRLFGTEGQWILPPNRKVIAWMPLPSPYKED